MGDEFQLGSGSWWDTTRNRSFDSGTTPPASISTTLNTIASFGSTAGGGGGSMVLQGGGHDQSSGDGGGLADQNLQMMGLGLSSQNLDWDQALLGEKVESSFRSLLQEDYHHQKLYSGPSSDDSSVNEFKQINRSGFNLDQTTPFSSQAASSNDSTITSGQNLNTGFQVDFHGMLLSDNQSTYQNRSPMNYQYPASGGGGGYGANAAEFIPSANKYQQFLRTSQPPPPPTAASGSHLHFTNNTPFWNASAPPAAMADGRSSFFPAGLQAHQIPPPPSFDDNLKNLEIRDLSAITKKNNTETSNKRPRGNEAPTPMPAFKAKKEKMGDRITALQQLVSPFGKTDTASVLSEAIAYIKFLHEQVSTLSNPYMKNGAPIQHQQKNPRKQKGHVKTFEVEGCA
uniref:Transcription factor bhlh123 n=1 Tax=Phtheirospermum japonicum TaxID=374723 RepID=A0A830C1E8_9LAMI